MIEPRDKAELTDAERNLIADLNSIGHKGMAEKLERQLWIRLYMTLWISANVCAPVWMWSWI